MKELKIKNAFVSKAGRIVFEFKGQTLMHSISAFLAVKFLKGMISGKKMYEADAELFIGAVITAEEVNVIPAGTAWTNEATGDTGEYEQDRLDLVEWKLLVNKKKARKVLAEIASTRKISDKLDTSDTTVTVKTKESDPKSDKKTKTQSRIKEKELTDNLPD